MKDLDKIKMFEIGSYIKIHGFPTTGMVKIVGYNGHYYKLAYIYEKVSYCYK